MAARRTPMRQIRLPLLEGLEARTLFSGAQHFVDHRIFVRGHINSNPVEYPAVVVGSEVNSGADPAPAADFTIAQSKNLSPTPPERGSAVSTDPGSSTPTIYPANEPRSQWDGGIFWIKTPKGKMLFIQGMPPDPDEMLVTLARGGELAGNSRPVLQRSDQDSNTAPAVAPTQAPAAAAAAAVMVSSTAAPAAAAPQILPKGVVVLQQSGGAGPEHTDQTRDATADAPTIASVPLTELATGPLKKTSVDLAEFFVAEAMWKVGGAMADGTTAVSSPGIFSSAAMSVDFMEKLLISNAVSLAHVANGNSLQLYQEDEFLWKSAAGIAGSAILAAAVMNRDRSSSQPARRRRQNARRLCIGEKR